MLGAGADSMYKLLSWQLSPQNTAQMPPGFIHPSRPILARDLVVLANCPQAGPASSGQSLM
jgi:hypothetical protein